MLEAHGKKNRILFKHSSAENSAQAPGTSKPSWSQATNASYTKPGQHQRKDDSSTQPQDWASAPGIEWSKYELTLQTSAQSSSTNSYSKVEAELFLSLRERSHEKHCSCPSWTDKTQLLQRTVTLEKPVQFSALQKMSWGHIVGKAAYFLPGRFRCLTSARSPCWELSTATALKMN